VRKELRPLEDQVSCDVCGRTILKGERTEVYLDGARQRRVVCELCMPRAAHEGWIRESGHGDLPVASRRAEPRRSLLGRMRRRREEEEVAAAWAAEEESNGSAPAAEVPVEEEPAPYVEEEPEPVPVQPGPRVRDGSESGPRDPRHVRAVPTNAQVKVERALELFNGSEHRRTVAGLTRTLGDPWVRAAPSTGAPSEVAVVVAWELSWYRYRVDLGDALEPIVLVEKGTELEELPEAMREWNGSADAEGRLRGHIVSER